MQHGTEYSSKYHQLSRAACYDGMMDFTQVGIHNYNISRVFLVENQMSRVSSVRLITF